MTGHVDGDGRALLPLSVGASAAGRRSILLAWVHTAFTGELLIPRAQIAALGMAAGPVIQAILADGSQVGVDTFTAYLDLFGNVREIEVVANDGNIPLMGVGLLRSRRLTIDYAAGSQTFD